MPSPSHCLGLIPCTPPPSFATGLSAAEAHRIGEQAGSLIGLLLIASLASVFLLLLLTAIAATSD